MFKYLCLPKHCKRPYSKDLYFWCFYFTSLKLTGQSRQLCVCNKADFYLWIFKGKNSKHICETNPVWDILKHSYLIYHILFYFKLFKISILKKKKHREKLNKSCGIAKKYLYGIHKISTVNLSAKSILTRSYLLEPIKKLTIILALLWHNIFLCCWVNFI